MSTPGLPGANSLTTAPRDARLERPDDVGRLGGGDPLERCCQLFERLAPGNEFGDEPALGAWHRPGCECWHQTRLDGGRLADARWADHDQQWLVLENGDHLGHCSVAAEEVLGVRLLERLEAAVRVTCRYERRRRRGRYRERVAKVADQLLDRLLPTARFRIRSAADHIGRWTLSDLERPVDRWRRTAQQVLHEDTERVDVGCRCRQCATESLRCVVRTARERDHARADLVDAQVGHERVVLGVEQHVLRADPPVHHPMAVGGGHRGGDRLRDRERPCRAEAVRWYPLAQMAPGHQPTHHHGPVRLAPVVEQRNDVRMLDAS